MKAMYVRLKGCPKSTVLSQEAEVLNPFLNHLETQMLTTVFLSTKKLNTAFLSRMSQKYQHTRCEDNILDQTCFGGPAARGRSC